MHHTLILTLDIGTSVVKSLLLELNGREIAACKKTNRSTVFVHDNVECDMDALWRICADCISGTIAQVPEMRKDIAAVSLAGNMIGFWPLDKDGNPYAPAILWNDGRSVEIVERWRESGISEIIFSHSGNALTPGFTLPLLKWLQEHQPQTLDRAETIFFCKDFIRYKLTGEIATEETDASHVPGSLATRGFSDALFRLCGLEEYRTRFPQVLPSNACAGYVTACASDQTGLPKGIPVLAGLADVSAMLTGAGTSGGHAASLILGTSCLCAKTSPQPDLSCPGIGLSFLLPEGRYVRSLPNQTGMLAINWFIREFVQPGICNEEIAWSDLERVLTNDIPDGSDGLIFHPYLNSTGVIAPIYAPQARGRVWGLKIGHTRMHLLKSIYEGLGYAVADCFTSMGLGNGQSVCTVGGGAKSAFLCQLIADIAGMPLQTLQNDEVGALGLMMQAGRYLGVWSNYAQAEEALLRPGRLYIPSAERHAQYYPRFIQYQHLREQLSQEYKGGMET